MKKRILALLLAGLMTISLASCLTHRDNGDDTGTESYETNESNETTENKQPESYQTTDEMVYSLASLNLRKAASASAEIGTTVPLATELHRVKFNPTWSVVEYDGNQYFADSSFLTTDDLLAKNFTPVADKAMYANTDKVNVRKYPTTNTKLSGSTYLRTTQLEINEEVTVTAQGGTVSVNGKVGTWSKIKDSKGDTYYVATTFLSEKKMPTLADLGDYDGEFSKTRNTESPKTMYAISDYVNVRKYPSGENSFSSIIDTFNEGTEVKVTATATICGENWSEVKLSDGRQFYIKSSFLSETKGGGVLSFDQLLELYAPYFVKYGAAKTLYVSTNVKETLAIRKTPVVITGTKDNYSNCIDYTKWPAAKKDIKVLAYGTDKYAGWYIVNYEGGYYFVGSSYLTPNSTGAPSMTLETVLATKEWTFTAFQSAKTMTILKETPYYGVPEKKDENKIKSFSKDTKVTVVAEGRGDDGYRYYVIQNEDGGCLFVENDSGYIK